MSKKEIKPSTTVGGCYNLSAIIQNLFNQVESGRVTGLDGGLAWDLKEIQVAAAAKVETAQEIEKELKKSYPFEIKEQDGGGAKRVFDGSSADEKATDEEKASRAISDENTFDKKFTKALEKKVDLDVPVLGKADFVGLKGIGVDSVIGMLMQIYK